MFPTLYGKDSKGGLKVWSVETSGFDIIVRHGKLGGKIQSKVTQASGKNQGKANETSAEEQAVIEAKAKWVKQKKSGYFETQEEALNFEEFSPMKCQNYNAYAHKVVFGGFIQPKLNGIRVMIGPEGKAISKSGEDYSLPDHLEQAVGILRDSGALPYGLDSEAYAGLESQGGLSLQRIVSAFRKKNDDTKKLKLWVYDIPAKEIPAKHRHQMLIQLHHQVEALGLTDYIKVVRGEFIYDQEEYDKLHDLFVEIGMEGSVYRNADGLYEFGVKSYNMFKRKPRQDTEAYIVRVRKDKNGQGVVTGRLESGVEVDFLMLKEADTNINLREYENALTLIDTFVTLSFEEYSDAGVPTKPVGEKRREVRVASDGTWIVKE